MLFKINKSNTYICF